MALRVFAHELGHNLGTHHASTLNCSSSGSRVVIVSDVATCTADEYGDPFTVMGAASRMHPTNFSRGNFGWLSSGNTLTVTESGDHTLTPVATPDAGVKAIRIARTTDAYLLLEFRQPFGTQFETFGATSPVASGVSVRIVPAYTSRTRSYLLDTTPTTTSFADAPLAVGTTLVDPLTGVSITTLSTGTAGATVRVTFPGSTPTPSPSASPSPTPPPGDTEPPTAPSTVTATGLDHRRIRLTWTASSDNVGVLSYQVLRGGTAVGTVTGTTFTDTGLAPSTSYAYEVVAYDAAGNDSSPAGASGSTLARKDTRPPRPPKDLRSVRDDLTVTLRWRPSTDDVGVAGYRVFRNDRMIAVVDRPRFEDHLGRPGMRPTYRVRAFDAAGNVSRWSARIRA
jgi:hypothetical protein